MHIAFYIRRPGTEPDLPVALRQVVEGRGEIVTSTYFDDSQTTARGRFAGWRSLIAHLDNVDQIVVASAGDLPGKRLSDLLKILAILRHHDVGLYVHNERIDTISNGFALLDLIEAYRQTKLSQAIRAGQARAAAAGKRIGRPAIPSRIQR